MERVVLHSDLNNFFASVESAADPALKGRPIAVAGDPNSRHGIVLAKSMEARRCGVSTGETLWQARLKCPDIIFVPPHYDKYVEISSKVRKIYSDYTDMVEPYGLDECWLDVTGSRRLFGDGRHIADDIRRRIYSELGITVSVGVSYNKIFAKLGSDMKKPDATTVIDRDHFRDIVWPLPACELLYVGRKTKAKLHSYGIETVGQLAAADPELLSCLFGKNGEVLKAFASGEDVSPVALFGREPPPKSVSCGFTAPRDLACEDEVRALVMVLATKVSSRLRKQFFNCRTVALHVRDNSLRSRERRTKLSFPCRTSEAIYKTAMELYRSSWSGDCRVRSLSIHACDLSCEAAEQMSFEEELFVSQRQENLEEAADALRARFGDHILRRGTVMANQEICRVGLNSDHGIMPGLMKMK